MQLPAGHTRLLSFRGRLRLRMNGFFSDTGNSFTIILTLVLVAMDPVTPGEMDGAGVPGLGDLRAGLLGSAPLTRLRSQALLGCVPLSGSSL